MWTCRCINCITPPHLLKKLLESKNKDIRDAALSTILTTARLRGERIVRAQLGAAFAQGNGRRTIYDMRRAADFSAASVARTEDGPESTDPSVNRAFEGLGVTRDFYRKVLDRNSIDDRGMRLEGYVHYAEDAQGYNNAYWDGQKMVFGDGDGVLFTDFTGSLDVIAHELTHGVSEAAAGLVYHKQPGALNESMSDVFGSLVKQWNLGQTAAQADWIIGADIFTPALAGDALRSLKAPGTAYDSTEMGKDPQPDHISRYVELPDTYSGDWGGVHINSGIPNKAFCLAATYIGGYAWEAPGRIWYAALRASGPTTVFQEFADATGAKAEQEFGGGSTEVKAVHDAWREVGIRVKGSLASRGRGRSVEPARAGQERDPTEVLAKRIEQLAIETKALAREVAQLKAVK